MLRAVADSLFSIIYPPECRVCSREVETVDNGLACSLCWSETRFFTGKEMLCKKCGAVLGDEAAAVPVSCRKCDDYHFDRAAALGVYEKALTAAILNLKSVPHLPRRLKDVIAGLASNDIFQQADLLIPVPLSRLRRLERTFNQAEIIAERVSQATSIPMDRLSLARTVHTKMHRIGMDQKARELTIHNAFEVTRPKLIAGKNLVLIDDVLTSGATASQAAKTLKKSGAASVNVFTLARAVLH